MDSQHVKGSEILLKSAWQYFSHIFWLLLKKTSSRKSFLVVSDILGHFVNILTPDEKYSLSVKAQCLTESIQMILSQNQKMFPEFFSEFLQST